MKSKLQKLIRAAVQSSEAWAKLERGDSPTALEGLRPAFIAHRLAGSLSELEELLAVHRSLWPEEEKWRAKLAGNILEMTSKRTELVERGAEIAEEEKPDQKLAASSDLIALFEYFCQVRQSIRFYGDVTTSLTSESEPIGGVSIALKSLDGIDKVKRSTLAEILQSYISNSFLFPRVQLPSGRNLDERYSPLFSMMRSLKRKMTVNIEVVKDILKEADISPRTCEEVERLFHALEEALRDLRLEDLNDIASYQGHLIPGIGASGSVNVIPGKGHGSCARIVLAIAQGASAKSKSSIPNVVREIRAHLIHCTEKTEVAILLTDQWNEKLLKESEPDFAAYASRPPGRRKVLIPVVVWKGQMTVNPWP